MKNSSTITATGCQYGAGIGGGNSGSGGTIAITGGVVTATGGDAASGIGRGYYGSEGTLTIGEGVRVYKTGEGSPYATGPQDNVATRYQNMTVD